MKSTLFEVYFSQSSILDGERLFLRAFEDSVTHRIWKMCCQTAVYR